jgi:hypothetical protein
VFKEEPFPEQTSDQKGRLRPPQKFRSSAVTRLHERVLSQPENAAYLWHGFRSIASRQNAGSIAQHDQPAWILRNPTAVDRPSDRQVVMPVNDLFLAGVMRAFPEQFDGVFAFGFCHEPFLTQPRPRVCLSRQAGLDDG